MYIDMCDVCVYVIISNPYGATHMCIPFPPSPSYNNNKHLCGFLLSEGHFVSANDALQTDSTHTHTLLFSLLYNFSVDVVVVAGLVHSHQKV